MTLTITPAKLKGTVAVPPSKSQAHRLLIAAALAEGESVIHNVAHSEDIDATARCLAELGAELNWQGRDIHITGMGANAMSPHRRLALPRLDCGESGSTLRFLIPVALATRGGGIFTGRGRLMDRPQGPYFEIFQEKGIFFEQKEGVLTLRGMLEPGEYRLPGNVSSQFFTGLLFALPLLAGPSAIIPTTPLESEGYIHMTLQAMAQFGVEIPAALSLPPRYHPAGNQTYTPGEATVEGDWSQAAFWYGAKSLGHAVDITRVNLDSAQGDKEIQNYYVNLMKSGKVSIDVSGCPDLVPALALMAALRAGETTCIVNAARLRMKESDRLAAIRSELCKLGAHVEEASDSLTIRGRETLPGGGRVDAHNDHRIAMMLAIAATRCERPITLAGAESVKKSYPDFWDDYVNLGGIIEETEEETV